MIITVLLTLYDEYGSVSSTTRSRLPSDLPYTVTSCSWDWPGSHSPPPKSRHSSLTRAVRRCRCFARCGDNAAVKGAAVTHGEVEAQVPIGRGVQEGRAHSSPALLLKDQRQPRLNLSALRPEHCTIDVPAGEREKVLFHSSLSQKSYRSLHTMYTMVIP